MFLFIKNQIEDFKVLFRSIPSLIISLFILSVVCANLMANKELITYGYLALDCGYFFSWIMFLCMDIICKSYGPKASIKVSLLALVINLFVCISFWILSKTPGMWGAYYETENIAVNDALNVTFGGSWYVVLGSCTAFLIGSIVNAFVNYGLGRINNFTGFKEFAFRSYISTFLGQFADNCVFSTMVSKVFFGWSWAQVFVSAIIATFVELIFEVFFSGFGYKIVKSWEKEGVGKEYFEFRERK